MIARLEQIIEVTISGTFYLIPLSRSASNFYCGLPEFGSRFHCGAANWRSATTAANQLPGLRSSGPRRRAEAQLNFKKPIRLAGSLFRASSPIRF